MQLPLPLTRDLVLIGGGHAHALVLRRWGMKPLPGARLTLINPGPSAPYTGMLPGHIAGHYDREALEIDLVRLARFAGARLILGEAEGIDLARRRVRVKGRGEIAYDVTSIDIGIASDPPRLKGFAEHGIAAKPLGAYAERWAEFRKAVADGRVPPEIAVIGAGVGGVELALAMAHALRDFAPRLTLIEARAALPHIGAGARRALMARLSAAGITLIEGVAPVEVTAQAVRLADGREIPSRLTVGVAGARPHGWLAETGLKLVDGFIEIGPDLRTSDPRVFAAGDCAHMSHAPRPKAGVYAVRQAPVLAHNLAEALTGGARFRRYRPQRDYLKLVSLGEKAALADKFGLRLEGRLLWRWKDRIDRRFMEKFHDLPRMSPPPPPRRAAQGVVEALAGGQPMCAGCGAKVGGATLAQMLASLPRPPRADIAAGAGDDAAVLQFAGCRQVITTDQLRAFTEDYGLFARIAAVHALGDVWAMGARPQAALANVVLPPMSPSLQARTLGEIMGAAAEVMEAAGAAIVGGHTGLGAELSLGFTVTGLAETPVGKGGAQPGDALILTKPIGTGTILAAEMALEAKGEWVAAALASMARPQGAAAAILAPVARAMTDVTGFGLAGHLLEICAASGTGAEIALSRLPLLPGAEALAARGIRSTLWAANRAATEGRVEAPVNARAALLFDPQTAGGLLAAVPAGEADRILTALLNAGYDAAQVGRVTDQGNRLVIK
jgi:selenide,water dikinase